MFDLEALGDQVAEGGNSADLGCVVAGRDEVDRPSRASAITCSEGSPVR